MSDLHVEFDRDSGDAFIDSLDPSLCDVLVLAGDITTSVYAKRAIGRFCQRYVDKTVLWVHGNHEYYRTTRGAMNSITAELLREHSNLRVLDKDVIELEGQRLLGATLWYPDPGCDNWSDFRYIKNFSAWFQQEADNCRDFFVKNLKKDDIVITHMLPSEHCVAEPWKGNKVNRYFVHDLTSLIVERKPTLWMFGHTHTHVDVLVGETRCVCNPRGYPHEAKQAKFDPTMLLTSS